MKKNILTITWILLVVLTIAEYTFAEISLPVKIAFAGIMLASFIKYIGVAFQFLELKHTHGFWKFIAVFIVITFVILMTAIFIPNYS
jgi:energy-converting hydrogenase Eha subunit E